MITVYFSFDCLFEVTKGHIAIRKNTRALAGLINAGDLAKITLGIYEYEDLLLASVSFC